MLSFETHSFNLLCFIMCVLMKVTIMNINYGKMKVDINSRKYSCLCLILLLILGNCNNVYDDIAYYVLTLYSQSQDQYLNQYSCNATQSQITRSKLLAELVHQVNLTIMTGKHHCHMMTIRSIH